MAIKINGSTVIDDSQNGTFTGTMSVSGNVTGGNVNTAGIVSSTGNIIGGNIGTGGVISAIGNITGGNISGTALTGTLATASQPNVTGLGTLTGLTVNGTATATTVSATGNVVGGNVNATSALVGATVSATGNISGGNLTLSGNGNVTMSGSISSISGANLISGNYVSGTLLTNAQPNVTSVGTLGGLTVAANGNITMSGALSSLSGANLVSATNLTGTLTTAAQPNITSVGALTSLSVVGTVTGGNLATAGTISATGNITGGNISGTALTGTLATAAQPNVTSVGTLTGLTVATNGTITMSGLTSSLSGANLVSATNLAGTLTTAAQPNVTSVGTLSSLNVTGDVSAGGNITGGNLTAGGITLNANSITSTGSTLTIDPAPVGQNGAVIIQGNLSVTGNVTYIDATTVTTNDLQINVANNAATAAAANGAGLGVGPIAGEYATLAYNSTANVWGISNGAYVAGPMSASGNVTGGNVLTAGLISSTGAVTASQFNGSGAGLTSIPAGNLSGTTLNSGVVTSSLTTVGTLNSLTITANGNITMSGALSTLSGANLVSATNLAGTLTTAAQPNITSVGTLSSLSVSGNLSSGTAVADTNTTQVATTAYVVGQASAVTPTAIASAGAVGTSLKYARADHTHSGVTTVNGSAGAITNVALTTSTLAQFAATTSAQLAGIISDETGSGSLVFATSPTLTTPNIGAATGTSLNVSTGTVTLGAITNANANGIGNIGSTTTYFNTVHAKATSALYADLAEKYEADTEYEPGTVLVFGGAKEVTLAVDDSTTRVAGVVSTDPSYRMNDGLQAEFTAMVALQGRVPTKVVGPIAKGDLMVAAGNGRARADNNARAGAIIGKALENFDGGEGTIEVVVGRN